jgi:1-acyl-sn-glycerol-3-phosphate acyltransferase
LARECGVPVVPVALTGTADVLPKGGRYSSAPMQVRIGAAIDPDDISAAQLREQVVALRDSLLPDAVNRYALAA